MFINNGLENKKGICCYLSYGGDMFKEEKITLIKIKDGHINLRLDDDRGAVALIFIKDDQIIIRSGAVVVETTIESPEIRILN